MITKRTCSLLALALPAMMLAIACSDEEPSPSGKKPTIVAGEDDTFGSGSAEESSPPASSTPSTSTPSSSQDTKAADAGPGTPNGEGGNGNGGGGGGGGGIEPTDCALLQGQECLQCCIENNGGANNDIVNCVQNCVQ